MNGKDTQLEKWLSSFFDRVDSKHLSKGQQLFQANRLFGFEEGASQVEAMVNGNGLFKVTIYYNETDLMELGLPEPKKVMCQCSCSEDAEICEHSVCVVLYWAFQTEKALRQVVQPTKSARTPRKTDLTLQRLEKAAQSSQGPFDHLLRGYSTDHPLDFLMKNVYKMFLNGKKSSK